MNGIVVKVVTQKFDPALPSTAALSLGCVGFVFAMLLIACARCVADNPIVIPLKDRPSQVVLAGGGKYLAVAMQDPPMCAIIDLKSATVVKELPVRSNKFFLAGTLSHVLILDSESKQMYRWSLSTWASEPELPLPLNYPIVGAASGPFSDGPLMVLTGKHPRRQDEWEFFMAQVSPLSMMQMEPSLQRFSPINDWGRQNQVAVSGDGCIFDIAMEKSIFQSLGSTYRHIPKGGLVQGALPDFSGTTFYSSSGRHNFRGDPIFKIATPPEVLENIASWTPAMDSDWSVIHRTTGEAEIIPPGTTTPAIRIPNMPKRKEIGIDPYLRQTYLITSQSTLIETRGNSEIRLHRLDLGSAKIPGEFVHPVSTPATSVTAGEVFEYELQAISSTKQFAIDLCLGPPGMSIKANKLRWNVPADASNAIHRVVLQLSNDTGIKTFHSFRLRVSGRTLGDQERTPRSNVVFEARDTKRKIQNRKTWSEFQLPAIPTDMTMFGGSRFIALAYPELPLIDIVDVVDKSVRSIPLEISAPFHLVGTAKKLFLVTRGGTFFCYDAEKLELQRIKAIPKLSRVDQVIGGSYGNGPIGLVATYAGTYGLTMLDEETLEPLKNSKPLRADFNTNVSPDGRVFCGYAGTQFSFYDLAHFDQPKENPYETQMSQWLRPNFNGSIFFGKSEMLLRNRKTVEYPKIRPNSTHRTIVPSIHGNLYVSLEKTEMTNQDSAAEAVVYRIGSADPLLILSDMPLVSSESFGVDEISDPNAVTKRFERIQLLPEYQTFMMLPAGESKLVFRDFNLFQELQNRKMFVVDSFPPANAYLGKTYSHTIEIVGANAPYKLSLQDAPKGAKLDRDTLVWKVPADHLPGLVTLTVKSESNNGKVETFPMYLQVTKFVEGDAGNAPTKAHESRNWMVVGKPIVGRFVRIVDKKNVEIMLADGTLKQISIGELSLDDIEYALEMESHSTAANNK